MHKFISSGGPMGIFRFPLIGILWTVDAVKGRGIHLKYRNWLDEIVENPPERNLVYTLREFQPFADDFPEEKFHFIGPSVYARREEPFPTLPKPVIYISIGTILKGAERFFRTCMEAFEKEPVTVVLSVGSFDISKLGSVPENFVVRTYVPQIAVLKQAGLFLTHGGMNGVSEAMIHGVPMVVIPFVSDQPVNTDQAARLGLGRVLEYRFITSGILKDTSFAVMKDEIMKKNLQDIQKQIAHAPDNAGVVRIIEAYYHRGIHEQ